MWAKNGDIIHPDGAVERGPEAIFFNRRRLFARPEYRGSRHPLNLTMVRCVSEDVAVADGKWQLLGVRDATGKPLPNMEGQVSLVVGRSGGPWVIEAYRYTLKPPDAGNSARPAANAARRYRPLLNDNRSTLVLCCGADAVDGQARGRASSCLRP